MNIWLLILGMALVTYIPRVVPAFLTDKLKYGKRFGKFIGLIPFTAMTALVFPGVFSADAQLWYIGAIGAAVAIILSCIKKVPSFVVVLASVFSVMIVYLVV